MRAALADEAGINATDLDALEHLEADGPLTQRQLAERLSLTSGAITMLVDRLEASGWVRRLPHPSDRRSTLVELSPQVLARTPAGLVAYHARIRAIAAKVGPRHRAGDPRVPAGRGRRGVARRRRAASLTSEGQRPPAGAGAGAPSAARGACVRRTGGCRRAGSSPPRSACRSGRRPRTTLSSACTVTCRRMRPPRAAPARPDTVEHLGAGEPDASRRSPPGGTRGVRRPCR